MELKYEIGFTGACMLKDDSKNEGLVVLLVDASTATDVAFKDAGTPHGGVHGVPADVPVLVFANKDKSDLAGAKALPAHPVATHSYVVIPRGHVHLSPLPSHPTTLTALSDLGRASDHVSSPAMLVADPGATSTNLDPFVARMAVQGGVLGVGSGSQWVFEDPYSKHPSPNATTMKLPDEAVFAFAQESSQLVIKTNVWTLVLQHPQDGNALRIDIKNLSLAGIVNPVSGVTSPDWHWDLFYKAFDPVPVMGSRPLPHAPGLVSRGPNNDAPRCHPSQFP